MPLKDQSALKSRGSKARSKVFEMVVKELRERDQLGFRTFGCALEAATIDPLQEAYEEALDLSVYLRMAIYQRDHYLKLGK